MNEHIGTNDPTTSRGDWNRPGGDQAGDAVDQALGELLELEAERQELKAAAESRKRAEEERRQEEEEERRQRAEDERVKLAAELSSVEGRLLTTEGDLREARLELERSKVEIGCLQGALRVSQEAEAEARLGALESASAKGATRGGRVPAWILVLNALLIVAGVGVFVLGSSRQDQELARVGVEHRARLERLQEDFAQSQIAAARLLSKATSHAEREEARAARAEAEAESLRGAIVEATPRPAKGRGRPRPPRASGKATVSGDPPARRVERPRIPEDPLGEFELEL